MYLDGPSTSIFEGRRAEDEVFEMKELFRILAEYSLCGICPIQDDRFQYVNPAMATMFGYTVEEVLQRCSPLDLVCPDDAPLWRKTSATGSKTRRKRLTISPAHCAKKIRCFYRRTGPWG